MKIITQAKPYEEIIAQMGDALKVFIIGCGTCPTMCKTGGKEEVEEMSERLSRSGKEVSGWMVIPTACDTMTMSALGQQGVETDPAETILCMTCGLGVQRIASAVQKRVVPALDTLFLGIEEEGGLFKEACIQCGECQLGYTAGICPIVLCPKGLLNGPCGGTDHGKCEVDRERDCAWALIYKRLKSLGCLDLLRKYRPPKEFDRVVRPGNVVINL